MTVQKFVFPPLLANLQLKPQSQINWKSKAMVIRKGCVVGISEDTASTKNILQNSWQTSGYANVNRLMNPLKKKKVSKWTQLLKTDISELPELTKGRQLQNITEIN